MTTKLCVFTSSPKGKELLANKQDGLTASSPSCTSLTYNSPLWKQPWNTHTSLKHPSFFCPLLPRCCSFHLTHWTARAGFGKQEIKMGTKMEGKYKPKSPPHLIYPCLYWVSIAMIPIVDESIGRER